MLGPPPPHPIGGRASLGRVEAAAGVLAGVVGLGGLIASLRVPELWRLPEGTRVAVVGALLSPPIFLVVLLLLATIMASAALHGSRGQRPAMAALWLATALLSLGALLGAYGRLSAFLLPAALVAWGAIAVGSLAVRADDGR